VKSSRIGHEGRGKRRPRASKNKGERICQTGESSVPFLSSILVREPLFGFRCLESHTTEVTDPVRVGIVRNEQRSVKSNSCLWKQLVCKIQDLWYHRTACHLLLHVAHLCLSLVFAAFRGSGITTASALHPTQQRAHVAKVLNASSI